MRKKNVWLTWIYLSAKRYCVRISFLLALLLLPLLCLLLKAAFAGDETTGDIRIAVYLDCETGEDQTLEQELLKVLCDDITDLTFYACGTAEEAASDVAALKADGGVIIHGSLKEKIASGETDGIFELLSATSDVSMRVLREYIYAAYAKLVGSDVVVNVLAGALGVTGEDYDTMKEKVEEIYARRLAASEYQMFEYVEVGEETGSAVDDELSRIISGENDSETGESTETIGENGETGESTETAGEYGEAGVSAEKAGEKTDISQAGMIRGFAAVWLFAAGLFLAAELGREQARGHFLRFAGRSAVPAKAIFLLTPLLLLGLSALIAIAVSGSFTQILREAGCMLCYVAAIALVCLALAAFVRKEQILTGMIPVLTLASLVICPVFLDLGELLPVLKVVRMILPPAWYLSWF